jgi:hypothetical protein
MSSYVTEMILFKQNSSNRKMETITLCDSSVCIALGYGLDVRGSRVRFPAGAGKFSLHYPIQNGSGTHPVSCSRGIRGLIPWA